MEILIWELVAMTWELPRDSGDFREGQMWMEGWRNKFWLVKGQNEDTECEWSVGREDSLKYYKDVERYVYPGSPDAVWNIFVCWL